MKPTDRESFKQFCLRQLGAPVVPINLSEVQVDDCVDMSLYYYGQFHMDGNEKTYFVYSMTQEDISNGYITLPSNIIGAVKVFPVGQSIGTNSLFNMRYQFVMNDLYNFSNVSLLPYYMVMSHVQFIEELLVGQKPIRYNRHNNILYLDFDMSTIAASEYLVVEAYEVIDPTLAPDMWNDKYLQEYTIALIKKQWGEVLSLFTAPMPGNITLNGAQIKAEAIAEIRRLEELMNSTYSLASAIMIG